MGLVSLRGGSDSEFPQKSQVKPSDTHRHLTVRSPSTPGFHALGSAAVLVRAKTSSAVFRGVRHRGAGPLPGSVTFSGRSVGSSLCALFSDELHDGALNSAAIGRIHRGDIDDWISRRRPLSPVLPCSAVSGPRVRGVRVGTRASWACLVVAHRKEMTRRRLRRMTWR